MFPNLTMLYLHRNYIDDIVEVYKLRSLGKLRALTLNNNPMATESHYRKIVLQMLPIIRKLDNVVVVRSEREFRGQPFGKDIRVRLLNAYPEDFDGNSKKAA